MKPQDRTRAILRSGLTSTQRLVAVAVVDYCDAADESYPSADTLAHDTGLTERTCRKALLVMLDLGCFKVVGRRHGCRVLAFKPASLPPRPEGGSDRKEVPPELKDRQTGTKRPADRKEVPTKRPRSDQEATTSVQPDGGTLPLLTPKPKPSPWEWYAALYKEHRGGTLTATKKIRPTKTAEQYLKHLCRDHGEASVRGTWLWVLTDPAAEWWRDKRRGAALSVTFLTGENYVKLEAQAQAAAANPAGAEIDGLFSKYLHPEGETA